MSQTIRRTGGKTTRAALGAASLVVIAMASGAGRAAAADSSKADANAAGASSEVLVTAQFRSQKLQDTPIAITAVTGQLLESRSQTNISQVALQAPDVTLVPAGAVFGPAIGAEIRGVGQFDFNPAYEPGVGIYIDDVYIPTLTGSTFDLLDLDRVEILRGPQGTLTGRNSEGGAVKLFSKLPSAEDSGYLEATYGSRNRLDFRGSANFKLTDSLFVRLSASSKSQDGYVTNYDYGCVNPNNTDGFGGANIAATKPAGHCATGKLGQVDTKAVRGQVRYMPSTKIDWNLSADYTDTDQLNPAEVTTVSNNPNFICGRYCTYFDYTGGSFHSSDRQTFKGAWPLRHW